MTWDVAQTILSYGRDLVMWVAAFIVWLVGREWRTHQARVEAQFRLFESRVETMERDLDLERLRQVFLTRERFEDLWRERHHESAAIWDEIKRIRDGKR